MWVTPSEMLYTGYCSLTVGNYQILPTCFSSSPFSFRTTTILLLLESKWDASSGWQKSLMDLHWFLTSSDTFLSFLNLSLYLYSFGKGVCSYHVCLGIPSNNLILLCSITGPLLHTDSIVCMALFFAVVLAPVLAKCDTKYFREAMKNTSVLLRKQDMRVWSRGCFQWWSIAFLMHEVICCQKKLSDLQPSDNSMEKEFSTGH